MAFSSSPLINLKYFPSEKVTIIDRLEDGEKMKQYMLVLESSHGESLQQRLGIQHEMGRECGWGHSTQQKTQHWLMIKRRI